MVIGALVAWILTAVTVAVKQCSGEEVTVEEKREFIKVKSQQFVTFSHLLEQEANIMKRLKHPNIVRYACYVWHTG